MMKFNSIRSWIFAVLPLLLLWSCKGEQSSSNGNNAWNSGKIVIAADENLKAILPQLSQIYQHQFPKAEVVLQFRPQHTILNDFQEGKISSMIVSRPLTAKEVENATAIQTVKVQQHIFAYDAVAAIAAKNASVKELDIRQIAAYLQPGAPVQLVFDNAASGVARNIIENTGVEPALFKQALAVSSVQAVIDYVAAHPNAIGFIPYNQLSDEDSPEAKAWMSKVNVLPVRKGDTLAVISQYSIATFAYPLQSQLNLVLGNNPELVGRGFANFLFREKASKILLKAGMVPRYLPVRKINVHDKLQVKEEKPL
jgi:phosphate transport system substrate-binding protein